MNFKSIYLLISSLLLWVSCVDETQPIVVEETYILIFGNLFHPSDHLVVNVNRTSSTEIYRENPIENAEIRLMQKNSANGQEQLVTENFNFIPHKGEYESSEMVSTTVGNDYWIEVTIPGEEGRFVSVPITMRQPIEIDRIERVKGATRMVFHDPLSRNTDEDFNQYVANFTFLETREEFIGPEDEEDGFEIDTQWVASTDRLFDGNENAYLEYFGNVGNAVEASLYHMDPSIYEFYLRYSTQLYQNEGFEDEMGDPGYLFRAPPVQLSGNIYNDQTQETVLGNFGVIAISEARQEF